MGLKDSLFAQRSTPFALPGIEGAFTIRDIRGFERGRIMKAGNDMHLSSKDNPALAVDGLESFDNLQIALYLGDESGARLIPDEELKDAGKISATHRALILAAGHEANKLFVSEKAVVEEKNV